MAQSVDQQIKEDLAQLGIRKGSRLWPILAIVLAAVLSFLFLPHGEPLQERFRNACLGAEGRVLEPGRSLTKNTDNAYDADAEHHRAEAARIAAQDSKLSEALKEATGDAKTTLEQQQSDLKKQIGAHQEAIRWAEMMARMGRNGRSLLARCMREKSDAEATALGDDIDRDLKRSASSTSNATFQGLGARSKVDIYGILTTKTVHPDTIGLPPNDPPQDTHAHPQREADETFEKTFNDALQVSEYGKAFGYVLPLVADAARHLIRDLYYDFSDRLVELTVAIGLVALISVIPGLIGMVYRRNFWSWFLLPFGALLIITLWARFGSAQSSGAILILFLAQLAVLLLILRLRRYSNSDSQIPTKYFNNGLAVVLLLIAADWVVAGFGADTPLSFVWEFPRWPLGWYGRLAFVVLVLPATYTLFKRSRAWLGAGPKNIVVCLDGTTNTPDQLEAGRLAQTNVFKLFKMLKSDVPTGQAESSTYNASISKRYGEKQIGLYYSGVGNRFEYNPLVQILGGASGLGAADVVDRAYLDVMRLYRPGDRIFIAGFSRGAAIARLLAREIDRRGSPRTIWTLRLFGRHWTIWTSKRDAARDLEMPVAVLGCWDTVGAFGLAKNVAGFNFQKLDLFKDLTVPDNVEQAYHLVALDEQREEFEPTLMEPDPLDPTRIVEVWFSGDHANIGGGWATTKLSDLTLEFLLQKVSSGYADSAAKEAGEESWGIYLSAVNGNAVEPKEGDDGPAYSDVDGNVPFVIHPDPLGQLRRWSSPLYVYKPRELPNHAVVSQTVIERMTKAKPLYAPQSLFDLHDNLAKKRESVNIAVDRLRSTNSLEPEEHEKIIAFKDRLHLTRWPKYFEELRKLQPQWPDVENRLSNATADDAGGNASSGGPTEP